LFPEYALAQILISRISYATSMENIKEGMDRFEKLLNEGIAHEG